MSEKTNRNLGEFEILVLSAILRQGGDAYGVSIKREIEERTGRSPTLGALYATLARMEDKALVTSRVGEATAERGGRAKRHYAIEPLGQQQLEKSIRTMRSMTAGLFDWGSKA